MNNISPVVTADQVPGLKSVSQALWFAVFLGPLGLMYCRPIAGLFMTVVAAIGWGTVFLPVVMWVCAVLMAPWGVMQYNQRLLSRWQQLDS